MTNLDIHDIARISRSYGMGPFYAATPLKDQLRVLQEILRHWTSSANGPGGRSNPDRAQALELVRPVVSLDEALDDLTDYCGSRPKLVASSRDLAGTEKRARPFDAARGTGLVPGRTGAALPGHGARAGSGSARALRRRAQTAALFGLQSPFGAQRGSHPG